MKAQEVLRILRISRQTLTKYVKEGLIKVKTLPNGRYDYQEESVYAFLNKNVKRKTYIYARAEKNTQKKQMEQQIEEMKQFCFTNGYVVSGIFSDIAPDTGLGQRKKFLEMTNDILSNQVQQIIIFHKSHLSVSEYDFLSYLFSVYHCRIIIMDETENSAS